MVRQNMTLCGDVNEDHHLEQVPHWTFSLGELRLNRNTAPLALTR